MRENHTSGSEGGGAGNSTGPSYPYLDFRTRAHAVSPFGTMERGSTATRDQDGKLCSTKPVSNLPEMNILLWKIA